jgi:hypothetical protein
MFALMSQFFRRESEGGYGFVSDVNASFDAAFWASDNFSLFTHHLRHLICANE